MIFAECACGKQFTESEYYALKHGCDNCYQRNHPGVDK